jgi:hypothetical protein
LVDLRERRFSLEDAFISSVERAQVGDAQSGDAA